MNEQRRKEIDRFKMKATEIEITFMPQCTQWHIQY